MEKELKAAMNEVKNTDIKLVSMDIITINDIENFNKKGKYIYVIEGEVVKPLRLEDIQPNLCKLKIHKYNSKNTNQNIIYVGSSQNIKTRLKQHFIKNDSQSNYSLHMYKWNINEKFYKNIKIHLFEFDFDMEIIKVIEVKLTKKLNPLFGQGCIR